MPAVGSTPEPQGESGVHDLLDELEQRVRGGGGGLELVDRLRAAFRERGTESEYRRLFESTDAGFCIAEMIFDAAGRAIDYRFLETNPAFEQQTGWTNVVGRRVREFAPELESYWFERYGRVALTGEPVRFQHRVAALQRWYEVSATRFGAPEKRQVAMLFHDITQRKRDEEAIQQREADLKRAQAAAHLGSWRWDVARGEMTWTEELYRITGFDPTEGPPSYAAVLRLLPPADRTRQRQAIRQARAGEEIEPFELRMTRPDGEERVLQSCGIERECDAAGRPALLFGTVLDVTERKWAEAALRESEERWRLFAEHAPAALAMFDRRMRYVSASRRWLQDYGLVGVDVRGSSHYEIFPDLPGQWREVHRRAMAGEVVRHEEDCWPRRDGSVQWLRWEVRPWHDAMGEIAGIVIFSEDITARKQAESALHQAHEELRVRAGDLESMVAERTARLQETVHELEAFSYSLSHDMRAPLRAMKGFSEVLEAEYGPQLGGDGSMYLRRISAAAGRLDQLIQDVLAYSRVVRERVKLTPVDLDKLVRQLVDENPALQSPKAMIEVRSPLHPVLGHEAYLMQVMANLLYNAVKFVAPGKQPRVRIWTELTDAEIRLYVQDNGIGIPPEARGRLFGMFQRFHHDASYEGTGIGLAIVRKAVERMGGTVSVVSEPGQGSTFCIQMRPATPDE